MSLFLSLSLLAFQVYITVRLFINFLFWQQIAVLGDEHRADHTSARAKNWRAVRT